jgi:hypothetical protein
MAIAIPAGTEMKTSLKSRLKKLRGFDFLFSILVIPAAYLLLMYRRAGSGQLPRTTLRLKDIGVFPIRNHYYEPLFDGRLLSRPLQEDRHLPGIEFNVPAQLELLNALSFANELKSLNLTRRNDAIDAFQIQNGTFESGDADFLYQLIRHIKPLKVVEIGSGNSTKIARLALKKNKSETGAGYQHICVEPYEQPWLESLEGVSVVRERIEDCQFNWTTELDAGDLLFVDSTHIVRPQGDVLKEYLEIFPQLRAGVYVHIHDIFTPKDYPKSWVVDDVRFWNEQYLLEALLTDTHRYEVVAALNFLKHKHYDQLSRVCPYISMEREPGSFYFRVKA